MSASSSSNTSSNTGPNRFRGDAASFSPCQPTNAMNQQFFQQQVQQVQQQQLYAQYLYNNGSMMQNHFYQYMPQYVIPGTPAGAYSETAYYPYSGYQMPPPQMGYPMMQPTPVNTINYSQGSKISHKKNNKNGKYFHPSQGSYQAHNQHSPKKEEHIHRSSQSPHDSIYESSNSYAITPENETVKNENSASTAVNEIRPDSKEKEDSPSVEKGQGCPRIRFPLYFNINAVDFSKQRQCSSERRNILEEKNGKSKGFSSNENNSGLLINTRSTKIIDLNSNSSVISKGTSNLIKINDNDTTNNEDNNDETNNEKKIEDTKLKQQPTSNWASVLQSSSAVKNRLKSKESSSTNTTTVNPAPLVVAQTPASPVTHESATFDFNMNNESSQPLGALLLRIMFDENYSVTKAQNKNPIFKIIPRGLSNTGNICYMNSILQVLIYCEPFNKLLKLIESKSLGSLSSKSTTPLLDSTIKFFNDFVAKSNKALSPEDFYMNLIALGKFQHLKWGQQEDAEEFLGYYLDGLNEELLTAMKSLNTPQIDSMIQVYSSNCQDTVKANKFNSEVKNTIKVIKKSKENIKEDSENEWSEVGANNKKINIKRTVEIEPTPITDIFGGQFKSVLTIPKSASQSQKSVTLDPFQNLQLDISEAETIEEAMMNLNSMESISYKSSNKDISIKKQTFIDKLPSILMVHLKRFSYLKDRDVGIEKVLKKISYDHNLTIPKELLSCPMPADYSLIGVVYHHGASAGAGHYTCDVLRRASFKSEVADAENSENYNEDEWIRIDDTSIKNIDAESVLNSGEESTKTAYILLYQKCS